MEYVLLGFLLLRSLNQYELYQALKNKVSPFYQASLGSIQSTLKKLESGGYVTVSKVSDDGRKKNIYTITDSGKARFSTWMAGDINENKFEAETSTRLFFLGLMPEEERKGIINGIIALLQTAVAEYEEAERTYKQRTYEEKYSEVVKYQFKTLNLGMNYYRHTLAWFEELRKEMEGQ